MDSKKFTLVNIDVDQMTMRDKRAFSTLYKMLLSRDEVIVPLTVDQQHKQICSFEQICLCFIALQKAVNNPLEINLLEQVDTDGNKFFEVALTKVKAIEGTEGKFFPPFDEEKYSVREPLQAELKRSNKKPDATADATADAIADDNKAIAREIFAELTRKNFVKNQVKSIEVENLIFQVIQKYFG